MLPAFRKDGSVNVVIESPRGASVKFKYDPKDKVMTISRPLPIGLTFPYDWGFVPSTRASDGDPLDAVVLWDCSSYPGVVISSRLIGVLKVEQNNAVTKKRERNDRVAVLPLKAPRHESVTSVFDLSERARAEIEHFFVATVAFENKGLAILGWADARAAEQIVREAARNYRSRNAKRPRRS
jgi:inorganic pyrophosphatase